ncbi:MULTISPECIES: S26 family signal peptidase [Sphingobium]|uniref:S26 family signal peptidase n=1 Tax=Sphingobium TaxID=165695 RepID=UPI000B3CC649|nr:MULTISPECIES: S26 family signal peptidase [Sphingomonadaceae]NML87692.1 peptidase [Sphingobium sp. TB-6]
MLRLAWTAARAAWPEIRATPRKAAMALGAGGPNTAPQPRRFWQACAIILPISAVACSALPRFTLVMSPSIDAWLVHKAPGTIRRGDLVSFKLRHPLAGPAPVDVTKYVLCMPGDRIEMIEKPSMTPGARDGWYRCNGKLIGISKPVGRKGQRLRHWRPTEPHIPAGMVYVGSSYAGGFDSRYFGPVPLHRLTRMEKLL